MGRISVQQATTVASPGCMGEQARLGAAKGCMDEQQAYALEQPGIHRRAAGYDYGQSMNLVDTN